MECFLHNLFYPYGHFQCLSIKRMNPFFELSIIPLPQIFISLFPCVVARPYQLSPPLLLGLATFVGAWTANTASCPMLELW